MCVFFDVDDSQVLDTGYIGSVFFSLSIGMCVCCMRSCVRSIATESMIAAVTIQWPFYTYKFMLQMQMMLAFAIVYKVKYFLLAILDNGLTRKKMQP